MGQYKIIDTGYANTSKTGSQETMANSGTAISFNSTALSFNFSNNSNSNPNPARYSDTETNFISTNNPPLTISGTIDRTTSAYETLLVDMEALCTTKGLKLLYYSDLTDGYKSITNALGSTSYGSLTVGGSIKSLLVRCQKFSIKETPNKSQVGYTLDIIRTSGASE